MMHYDQYDDYGGFDQCDGGGEGGFFGEIPSDPLEDDDERGYVFWDNDRGLFLSVYECILRDHVLLYTVFKNLVGFLVLVMAILSPSMARNLYIFVFIWCSVTNTIVAMVDPSFYVPFTKTGVSMHKKAVYQFYAKHSVRILLGFAFVQHLIASVFWLKNLSVIMRWQREEERAQRRKHHEEGGDDRDNDNGTDRDHARNRSNGKKLKNKKTKKSKKELKEIKRRERRMKQERVEVPPTMYTTALVLGILNFAVLIPMGVDWNQYGVVWFSSSAISLTMGQVFLLMAHFNICCDDERSKRKRRRRSNASSKRREERAAKIKNGAVMNGSGSAKIKLIDRSDGNGQSKKAMFILWKRADEGESGKMRTLAVDKIATAEWKEEEEEMVLRNVDPGSVDLGEVKEMEVNEDGDGAPKRNGLIKHKKRITLMDGTVKKCQCRECVSRREKRRAQRKKIKLLRQMQRCQEESHPVEE